MPHNHQAKVQSNLCADILAKFVKQQELESFERDSIVQNQNPQTAEGKWEDEQNLKFIVFIDYHNKIFSSKQRRKSEKIFKILSNYLGNRTPAQCRSHYQKVMIKFKTIAKLKKHFKELFGDDVYNSNFQQFVDAWRGAYDEEDNQKSDKQIKQIKETKQTGSQTEPMFSFQQNFTQMMMAWQFQQYLCPFFPQSQLFWTPQDQSHQ